MDTTFIIYLGRHTLETALLMSAPVLVTCLVVGLLVTLLQAVTSIRDMTLTIVPKLLAVGAVCIMCASWMLQIMLTFSTEIFSYIENIGR